MEDLSDKGEDTRVGYDIATAPSAVYEIVWVFRVSVVIGSSVECRLLVKNNDCICHMSGSFMTQTSG